MMMFRGGAQPPTKPPTSPSSGRNALHFLTVQPIYAPTPTPSSATNHYHHLNTPTHIPPGHYQSHQPLVFSSAELPPPEEYLPPPLTDHPTAPTPTTHSATHNNQLVHNNQLIQSVRSPIVFVGTDTSQYHTDEQSVDELFKADQSHSDTDLDKQLNHSYVQRLSQSKGGRRRNCSNELDVWGKVLLNVTLLASQQQQSCGILPSKTACVVTVGLGQGLICPTSLTDTNRICNVQEKSIVIHCHGIDQPGFIILTLLNSHQYDEIKREHGLHVSMDEFPSYLTQLLQLAEQNEANMSHEKPSYSVTIDNIQEDIGTGRIVIMEHTTNRSSEYLKISSSKIDCADRLGFLVSELKERWKFCTLTYRWGLKQYLTRCRLERDLECKEMVLIDLTTTQEREIANFTASHNNEVKTLGTQLGKLETILKAKDVELGKLKADLSKNEMEKTSIKAELRTTEKSQKAIEDELKMTKLSLDRLKSDLVVSDSNLVEERKKIERLTNIQKDYALLSERLKGIEGENKSLSDEIEELRQVMAQSKANQKHLKSQKNTLEKDLAHYKEIEVQFANATKNLEDIKTDRDDLIITVDRLKKNRYDQDEELNRLRLERDELNLEVIKEKENLRKLNLHFAKKVLQIPHVSDNYQPKTNIETAAGTRYIPHISENIPPQLESGEDEMMIDSVGLVPPASECKMKRGGSTRSINNSEIRPLSRIGSRKKSLNAFNIGRSLNNVRSSL